MNNKKLVQQFIKMFFVNGKIEKIPEYIVEDYIQHNPRVETGHEGFINFFKKFQNFKPKFELLNICSEDNMVFLFHKCTFADGTINKVCDIFRLENHQIVEHWDVIESHLEKVKSINNNGIF